MVDKVKRIWLEGEFIDWDDAKVHILTHTMHYGLGAFEGIRAYKRADGSTRKRVRRVYRPRPQPKTAKGPFETLFPALAK